MTRASHHHIGPDIDAERDLLMDDCVRGMVEILPNSGLSDPARWNGEGDPYYTDGEIDVAVLSVTASKKRSATTLPPPKLIALKTKLARLAS